jgi:5-methylcytosine-specific restriction endonuclease McrA
MAMQTTNCVVLNASYEPLTVVTSRRALRLFLEGKAIIVEEHPVLVVKSVSKTFPVPLTIALKRYVKGRNLFTKAQLTQKNLFIRDNHTCQYCGRTRQQLGSKESLTRDHVFPLAKGGKNTWSNVVTSCSTCNNKKADKLLKDTSFTLKKELHEPTIFEIWARQKNKGEGMEGRFSDAYYF